MYSMENKLGKDMVHRENFTMFWTDKLPTVSPINTRNARMTGMTKQSKFKNLYDLVLQYNYGLTKHDFFS